MRVLGYVCQKCKYLFDLINYFVALYSLRPKMIVLIHEIFLSQNNCHVSILSVILTTTRIMVSF